MKERTWPTEDGGQFVISGHAIDWEMKQNRRLFDLYSAEMDRIGGPQKRIIEVPDARACYMNALGSLLAELANESEARQ